MHRYMHSDEIGGRMIYMTGEKETLKELREKEGFTGTQQTYDEKFAKLNPELCAKFPTYKSQLPPYVPVYLVTIDPFDMQSRGETFVEVMKFSLNERKNLRAMQEDGNGDIVTTLSMSEIMEDMQVYTSQFRKLLKTPLISTPWTDLNASLTGKHLFKIFGEGTGQASSVIEKTPTFITTEALYKDMTARDAFCKQLYALRYSHDKESKAIKASLQKQIDELTQRIRVRLPKKIDDKMMSFLKKRFTESEIRLMRKGVKTTRSAGKLMLRTTNLDFLKTSKLGRAKMVADELKMLGSYGKYAGKLVNWGAVTYDTVEAYNSGGKVARTFIAGATTVVVSTAVTQAAGGTAALGGYVIGALAGDIALGSTILICSPIIGWAVLLIVGVAVASYVGNRAKEATETVYDLSEIAGTKAATATIQAVDYTHNMFIEGWNNNADWIPEFYGSKGG